MNATPGQAAYEAFRSAVPDWVCNVPAGPWAELSPAIRVGFDAIAAQEPHATRAVDDCPIAVVLADGMHDCTLTAGHGGDHDFADKASGVQEPHAAPELAALTAERDGAYRERARLIAFLAACYPSSIALDADPEAPGWAIIYVDGPTGQMTWHLAPRDLDLFPHVEQAGADDPTLPVWDGHTTGQKYERLAELIPHALDAP